MPDILKTPGQVNYEAYRAVRYAEHVVVYAPPWAQLFPVQQAAWEAAAQAVLEAQAALCPICNAE